MLLLCLIVLKVSAQAAGAVCLTTVSASILIVDALDKCNLWVLQEINTNYGGSQD